MRANWPAGSATIVMGDGRGRGPSPAVALGRPGEPRTAPPPRRQGAGPRRGGRQHPPAAGLRDGGRPGRVRGTRCARVPSSPIRRQPGSAGRPHPRRPRSARHRCRRSRDKYWHMDRVGEPGRPSADNQAVDNQAADNQAADNPAADSQAADNPPEDNQVEDNQVEDNPAADNRPVERTPRSEAEGLCPAARLDASLGFPVHQCFKRICLAT